MTLLSRHWKICDYDLQRCRILVQALRVDPLVAQVLINRGIETVEEAGKFLRADISELHDPFLFKDMDKAVARVRRARDNKERVLIFGDYDVDGVTSSALLGNTLRQFGLQVAHHIPHRMTDGYGLNSNVRQIAKDEGAALVITVDCGITAVAEVDLLNESGIDCIIFDHHEPLDILPRAVAVVDPKRKDCPYPFKHLATVGLMAKFSHALLGEFKEEWLDLVALGTIADVVPLKGENRIFVSHGLAKIGATKNKGLMALIDVAKIRGKKMKPYYVGFILGPRLNATGRMDSATKSLELLMSEDEQQASLLAQSLEDLNSERQRLQRTVVQDAVDLIEQEVDFHDQRVIVLSKEGWHKGVLGIVASRVSEMYYRPAVIISLQDGMGTASARSIEGFHLHEALTRCSEILENFGGHKLAAGLTIRAENIASFKNRINEFARDVMELSRLMPMLNIDAQVPLSSLNLNLVEQLDLLEPYGEGNPGPVFCSKTLRVKNRPIVMGKETLKFWVTDGVATVSAVGFGMAKWKDHLYPGQQVDLAYQLIIDDWNKAPVVQLKLKDIKESAD